MAREVGLPSEGFVTDRTHVWAAASMAILMLFEDPLAGKALTTTGMHAFEGFPTFMGGNMELEIGTVPIAFGTTIIGADKRSGCIDVRLWGRD